MHSPPHPGGGGVIVNVATFASVNYSFIILAKPVFLKSVSYHARELVAVASMSGSGHVSWGKPSNLVSVLVGLAG